MSRGTPAGSGKIIRFSWDCLTELAEPVHVLFTLSKTWPADQIMELLGRLNASFGEVHQ